MTLDKLKTGKKAVITSTGGKNALRMRLLDMGLIPGTEITVSKTAPMGDPIQLLVRGYELTVRKADASLIEIIPEEEK